MGKEIKRIRCPAHQPDNTPSCSVYADGWLHCHSCGHHARWGKAQIEEVEKESRHVEDVEATLNYIRSLPLRNIRGHAVHVDESGYYLLYPGEAYYKLRLNTDGPNKYRSPAGHQKPLFVAQTGTAPLIVVEGEFNALSLSEVTPCTVVSPGAATDFASPKHLSYLLKYDTLVLVVDCDKAGGIAAIQLGSKLKAAGKAFRIVMVKQDFNDVYCEKGKEGLREYAASLGLPTRVPQRPGGVPALGAADQPGDDYAQERVDLCHGF